MGAALPPFRFRRGLHTTPMEASSEHVSDCTNVYTHNKRVEKRGGSLPLRQIGGLTATPYMGWANGSASGDPSAVAVAGTVARDHADGYVFMGHSATFNTAKCVGFGYGKATLATGYVARDKLIVEYWNGSSWTALPYRNLYKPFLTEFGVFSHCAFGTDSTGATGTQFQVLFVPPTDWATKTVAGQTKYWIRVGGWSSLNALTSFTIGSSTVNTTENRVLNVFPFTDRNGTDHLFAAYLYGEDGKNLRFEFDGVVMTQSEGLQPDGTSVMFSPETQVSTYYHAATGRVIGHVSGLGWFYFQTDELYVDGSGNRACNIYNLTADATGRDTPYFNILAGLRGAIPDGTISTIHQGRLFAAEGQRVTWSAPSVYPDIWAYDFELDLADEYGNCTGLAAVGGVLCAFKRNSIWTIQDDGTDNGYYGVRLPGNVGCVSRKSIVVTGDQAFFVAEDGVYMFDGATVTKISGDIDGLWIDPSFCSDLEKSMAVYHTPTQQYRLLYPSSGSNGVCDAALYADIAGWVERVAGDTPAPAAWWKQGKYVASDWGFKATAMAADPTASKNRMLYGDVYGVIWQADWGFKDGATVVKGKLRSERLGLGSAQKTLLRWAVMTQRNRGSRDTTVNIIPEGREDLKQSATLNPYPGGVDGSLFTSTGTFTTGGIFSYSSDESAQRGSFGLTGKWFEVELLALAEAPWELEALELEFNTDFGRRS